LVHLIIANVMYSSGRGIPNILAAQTMRTTPPADSLPPATEAAQWYTTDLGTTLTEQAIFGRDPFVSDNARNACQTEFVNLFPDINVLLRHAVNGDFTPLQDAVLTLVHLTRRHAP